MSKNNPKVILETTLKAARGLGADAAEAIFLEREGLSVSVRLGGLQAIERTHKKTLGLRVFLNNRTASLSTQDLSKDSLKNLAEKAVVLAQNAPKNPFADLATPAQFFKGPLKDLEIFDPTKNDPDELKNLALEAEAFGLEDSGITNSEGASCGWVKSRKVHLTSRGFEGGNQASNFSLYTVLLAGEGAQMERDYEFSKARFFEDLDSPEKIGKKAAARTVQRLNPRKIKSGSFPVIFHRRVSGGILAHFCNAIKGHRVSKGVTFLSDQLGRQIFSKNIFIKDDPLKIRGLGSRLFDAEGLGSKEIDLVSGGILKHWLLDLSSAKEMGLESNGRATRNLAGPSLPSSTNLFLENGDKNLGELIKEAKQGFLVCENIGMGVNEVTGDYSRGASGFWFENGEIAYPVSEVTIAGNLKDMFLTAIPANDLKFKDQTSAPSLLIPEMTIAGT